LKSHRALAKHCQSRNGIYREIVSDKIIESLTRVSKSLSKRGREWGACDKYLLTMIVHTVSNYDAHCFIGHLTNFITNILSLTDPSLPLLIFEILHKNEIGKGIIVKNPI
jgi:adenosyl cobinamide kinase/adenosyl cobinamide phosphate guanylyltransferase